ncbi:hypothetical protein R6G85_06740 [Actinotignum urinale]|uniref:Uncharacterized protein n=1 Tax=Actinotignum urinale TaxID=190146 RepID=A0ABU5G8I6_9ACTO|nr:hypothetical protein [Actinotignum urinale]MDY5133639.1 hypothetical protein [Actinotignum urinale]MDY5152170.1 hypothetical protein [Actinotignum urinale]
MSTKERYGLTPSVFDVYSFYCAEMGDRAESYFFNEDTEYRFLGALLSEAEDQGVVIPKNLVDKAFNDLEAKGQSFDYSVEDLINHYYSNVYGS